MEQKFYVCHRCGNLITKLREGKSPVVCCGKIMEKIISGTTDAVMEKHLPVCAVENGKIHVSIGETTHPMENAHYIEWIALRTGTGIYCKYLSPQKIPQASFSIGEGEQIKAVYAYCNIHGLWEA